VTSEPTGPDRNSLLSAWGRRLVEGVDPASLVFFRVGFGLMMAGWAADYLATGRVDSSCVAPRFHFTYYGLDWIRPWPGGGMSIEFAVMVLLGVCVAAGLWYRVSSVLLALCFTHFFLIDRTLYQNHYYLLALVSWMMTVLPVHRCWAVDGFNGLSPQAATLPNWALWLVRFHVGLPYVYGGIAKIDADWLAGQPMRQVLAGHAWVPGVGPWLLTDGAVLLFTWGGLLFDLLVVPLLLWRRTRGSAYVVCVLFHLTNAFLFNIHVFPWFMIMATTIFYSPDWPRRLLGSRRRTAVEGESRGRADLSARARWGLTAVAIYCLFHLVWPLRHQVYGGQTGWTERGHYFAWRMMLRGKTTGLRYYVTDAHSGQTWVPDIRELISDEQSLKFARDPEMILHLGHYLAERYQAQLGREVEVRALVLSSLNGRKPQLLIDPNVDLAREPRGFHRRPWVLPNVEPLPREPWSLPLSEWERHVTLPPRPFLTRPSHDVSLSER
jgi:hypothetical protein